MVVYILNPDNIYNKSIELIKEKLCLDESLKSAIIARAIHATGDLDIGKSIVFSPNYMDGIPAFIKKTRIITDINMVKSGITSYRDVRCYINDPGIILEAKNKMVSRSYISMKKACRENYGAIFVIGDAPTALISLIEEIVCERCMPAMVIGVPVGFVSAVESKMNLLKIGVPFITNLGNKGGSGMAAAMVNAIIRGTNVH